MGKVFLARDLLEDDREVALKVYPASYYHARLKDEFLALKSLYHPGVARALHFGVSESDGAPFFTLEFIRGNPLHAFVDTLPGEARSLATAQLLLKTTRAVAYLHRRGVLHLDLKPDNILVVGSTSGLPPRPVLIDFGLVRLVGEACVSPGHATLPYAPPESFTGAAPTRASDVYSLAAAFYRVFSGRYPVEGKSPKAMAEAHRSRGAAPLPEVPQPLERIFLRALAKDPTKRFHDAGELLRALTQLDRASLFGAGSEPVEVLFHEPEFVGRKQELVALESWLHDGRLCHPVLELLGGSGFGKSRFLEKAQTVLEIGGHKVLAFRSTLEPGYPILSHLERAAQVLLGLPTRTRSWPMMTLEAAKLASRQVLSRILPLLGAGLFILVDDLHLATSLEKELLIDAARALATAGKARGGILVSRVHSPVADTKPTPPLNSEAIAKCAPPARKAGTGLRPAVAGTDFWDGRLEGLATSLVLEPLTVEEALEIDLEGLNSSLASLSPERILALKRGLFDETGGHPLFFVQGLLDLAGGCPESGRFAPTERGASQLRKLSPQERDVAATLGLLDREASSGELADLSGVEIAAVPAAIERLRWRGLVAPRGAGFRIIHESIVDALTSTLATREKTSLHLRIAERLGQAGAPGAQLEAAWHFLEATESRRGIDCALESIELLGAEGAAQGARDSRTLLRAGEAAGASTSSGKALLEAASDALESQGLFAQCVHARKRLVSNLGATSRLKAGDVRRLRKLGSACHRAGLVDEALEHLQLCVTPESEKASLVESLRARADLALISHFRGQTDAALAHAKHGTDAWRHSTNAERQATVQSAVNFLVLEGQVLIRKLEPEEAITVLEEGLKLARKTDSRANTALLLNNLALAQHLFGKLGQALATFEKAEAIAKEFFDAAALVSIRSNVVQILARKGRFQAASAILDQVEESTAANQSKRLRLYCLYTRGIFQSLLGTDSSDLWSKVESQALDTNDTFLSRFARLYLAESHISQGRYSDARSTLTENAREPELSPGIRAPTWSRLALAEALLGRTAAARKARKRLDSEPEGPPLLSAWNQLQCGTSAMETADFEEAVGRLQRCRAVLRGAGATVGEVECALVLADLWIRRAAVASDPGRWLDRAEAEVAIARKLPLESPGDASPRLRDLRCMILEARVVVARWHENFISSLQGRKSRSTARSRAQTDGERRLRDLLARSSGDPALAFAPDLRAMLECLRAAAARLWGDAEGTRSGANRVRRLTAENSVALSAADRTDYERLSPWARFGLKAFEPLGGDPSLEPRHARALDLILRSLERSTGERTAILATLEEIRATLGATHLALVAASGVPVEWIRPDGLEKEAVIPGSESSLWAPCRFRGQERGVLFAARGAGVHFTASDAAFLEAAALALAPRMTAPPSTAAAASNSTDPSRGKNSTTEAPTASLEGTATVSHTRRVITDTALRSGSIARVLKEEGFIAKGRETLKTLRVAAAVAATDMPVLITGDSGTGKSTLARAIHKLSRRAQHPFLVQSASAVPPELFEADFFGYESGAFTGAERTRTGFLFQAEGGTFHLEEIGDLEPALQQRFLRVIEERSVRPLGATQARTFDVRFLVSTQRDLEAMVRRGEFRKDLYYRLNSAHVHLPPLSERRDEIEDLIKHHWQVLRGSRSPFTQTAMSLFRQHDWPGNIRELVGVLNRLSLETQGELTTDDVRAVLGSRSERSQFPACLYESKGYDELLQLLEKGYLEHLLVKHSGNLEAIASALGTTTRSIYRRFERLGLKPRDLLREP